MELLDQQVLDTNNPFFQYFPESKFNNSTDDEFSIDQYFVEKKIRSFKNLEKGWNFGEGAPPSELTIDKAVEISRLRIIYDLNCEVFPVGDGEIEVSLYQNEHFLDILIKKDLTMKFTHEYGIGSVYTEIEHIENVSKEEIEKRLSIFQGKCF